jgi:hypothetical protein
LSQIQWSSEGSLWRLKATVELRGATQPTPEVTQPTPEVIRRVQSIVQAKDREALMVEITDRNREDSTNA